MNNNKAVKITSIIGITIIGILTFWTVIIPILCLAGIVDICSDNS